MSTQLCPTLYDPKTVALQAFLSVEFSGQEYWNGLPFPPSGTLPNPDMEPKSLVPPAVASVFFTNCTTWEARLFTEVKDRVRSLGWWTIT